MKGDSHKAWGGAQPPKKILAIRLHALGDTIAAISALQNLKDQLPKDTIIDLIVKEEFRNIPENLHTFNKVYVAKGNTYKKQVLSLLPLFPKLFLKRYDAVLDLQNNTLSNFIRKMLAPKCFVEFDRFSPKHACIRTMETLNKAGIVKVFSGFHFDIKNKAIGKDLLKKNGVHGGEKLIVLNPAGAFLNRNWPVQNYVELAKLMIHEYGVNIKFICMGTEKIKEKTQFFEKELNGYLINLIDKTSQIEALSILQEIDLMISEDGALMHMAYLSHKNTVGIIGSSRSDWTDPKLPHTYFFNSDDMSCGNCMLEVCKLHANECMTRVTSQMVFEKAKQFLN